MNSLKKIVLLLSLTIGLLAEDIVIFENEYHVLQLNKKVKKLSVGNKEIINVSVLGSESKPKTTLKLFGKKSGNTSILITYRDNTITNLHVYINQNLGFIQKMINVIEPDLALSKVGDGSTVISGKFKDPHDKKRIYKLLVSAGIDTDKLMDITKTDRVNKMIRTKLYLVEINNNKAKDLGGVTGLSYFGKYADVALNPNARNGATFSGWLLDNTGAFTSQTGNSVVGTLNFLESKGIAKILDDTVLITTEDQNASFHVGGDVYIPTGVTQTNGGFPTIQLEEKEYGLRLTLTTNFMEKDDFMHMDVNIIDSEFDPNKEHWVQLGTGGFGSQPIEVPAFLSKDISTDVVSRSGQVIALGGRLHTEDVEAEEKIPYLGDIPWLGELFKRTITSHRENDLLFFLVPEIVDANEDIDDRTFYRDFKDESNALHDIIQDMNVTKEVELDPVVAEEALVVNDNLSSTPVAQEVEVVEEKIIIESETPEIDTVNKSKEIVLQEKEPVKYKETDVVAQDIVKEEVPILVPAKKEVEVTEVVVEDSKTKEVEQGIKKTDAKAVKKYSVTAPKIFIRARPVDGYREQVWIKGHKFTVESEKEVQGTTWMKIKDDCRKGCESVKSSLWISKLHTKEI